MPPARDWHAMREQIRQQLLRQTGADLDVWNRRVRATGIDDADRLKSWLTKQGVVGYPRMLLGMERFGYPEFMEATADELIDAQYRGKPELRAIYDQIIRTVGALPGVEVQARKTYVSLIGPKRTFARVQTVGKGAVALALRLDREPGGGLVASKVHDSMPVQLTLRSPQELDARALQWVRRALADS